jgi:hypothetical protein
MSMNLKLSKIIDRLSNYLADRKGLLPLVGILLVLINLLFQIVPVGWLTTSNLFLHLGVIVSIIGLMFYWVL